MYEHLSNASNELRQGENACTAGFAEMCLKSAEREYARAYDCSKYMHLSYHDVADMRLIVSRIEVLRSRIIRMRARETFEALTRYVPPPPPPPAPVVRYVPRYTPAPAPVVRYVPVPVTRTVVVSRPSVTAEEIGCAAALGATAGVLGAAVGLALAAICSDDD